MAGICQGSPRKPIRMLHRPRRQSSLWKSCCYSGPTRIASSWTKEQRSVLYFFASLCRISSQENTSCLIQNISKHRIWWHLWLHILNCNHNKTCFKTCDGHSQLYTNRANKLFRERRNRCVWPESIASRRFYFLKQSWPHGALLKVELLSPC